MKRLGKKLNCLEETIESYACSCTSCNCYCSCICSPGIMYIFINNNVDAVNDAGTSDYNEEQTSANYSK